MTLRKLSTSEIARPEPAELVGASRHPIVVVVENVRSAYNVGSILRTADALMVRHVYLTGFTPPGDHRGVHKSALGAQDTVPWSHARDSVAILDALRRDGYCVAAAEITDSPSTAQDLDPGHFPLALVLGNEIEGVSESALERCHLALELPQFGAKHSLNVAVAFGVIGYDLVRRWHHLN
ncbi:MAG: TrmH family RNA methyltransferase [Rhodothermales bacterium]|nr:TrmH family RNA methyltransferase [Rhodothermales bacterium]